MRTDTVYKRAFNRMMDILLDGKPDMILPPENSLRRSLDVSRTTVRKVLAELLSRRLIVEGQGGWTRGRAPRPGDRFPESETTTRISHVEAQFMEWLLRADTKPGTLINELELARQFGVATSGIREFLIRFSRFGLIEKKPNSGWLFQGFTEPFALDLFEIRLLFEIRSAQKFAELPDTSVFWSRLAALRSEHVILQGQIVSRFQDFSSLDNRFHLMVNEAAPNRFIDDFYGLITMIFHYHYQWNKANERERNAVAIAEHLDYIDALFSRDPRRIEAACRAHLASARSTLIRSLIDSVQVETPQKGARRSVNHEA
jgi:DNA-binding GntR family transcriptional regulator